MNRTEALRVHGARRTTREAFARRGRKLLKKTDAIAERKGLVTSALLIVVTVDPSKEGNPVVGCELLRGVNTTAAALGCLHAAGEVLARELTDPESVRR